jgi:hypothetical protein
LEELLIYIFNFLALNINHNDKMSIKNVYLESQDDPLIEYICQVNNFQKKKFFLIGIYCNNKTSKLFQTNKIFFS